MMEEFIREFMEEEFAYVFDVEIGGNEHYVVMSPGDDQVLVTERTNNDIQMLWDENAIDGEYREFTFDEFFGTDLIQTIYEDCVLDADIWSEDIEQLSKKELEKSRMVVQEYMNGDVEQRYGDAEHLLNKINEHM